METHPGGLFAELGDRLPGAKGSLRLLTNCACSKIAWWHVVIRSGEPKGSLFVCLKYGILV